jgi:hypothetical protein
VIEPYRVSTEAIRASVASLPDAGRRDLAIALQALSQLAAVQDALGEQFDDSTVEAFGRGGRSLRFGQRLWQAPGARLGQPAVDVHRTDGLPGRNDHVDGKLDEVRVVGILAQCSHRRDPPPSHVAAG